MLFRGVSKDALQAIPALNRRDVAGKIRHGELHILGVLGRSFRMLHANLHQYRGALPAYI